MSLLLTLGGLACWLVLFMLITVSLEELTPIPERHRFSLGFSTPPALLAAFYLPDYLRYGLYGEWSGFVLVTLTLYGLELLLMLGDYVEHVFSEEPESR
jgi:hypothetical protein